MELFIAICIDRHIDEVARPFSTLEKAIEYCRLFVPERYNLEEEELNDSMIRDNWVFYGRFGVEGDNVRVEKRILDENEYSDE